MDSFQWKYPGSSSEKRVKRTLEHTLKYSTFITDRLHSALAHTELSQRDKTFLEAFQSALIEFEPNT